MSTYSLHYRNVNTALFSNVRDLSAAVRKRGYDIIHLFARLSPDGSLCDQDVTLSGTELIAQCCEGDVKLLWIASENDTDAYVKGFKAAGKSLNLIMTISRTGTGFTAFLEKLLSRICEGESLPSAWTALVPQAEGSWQKDLPGCIFFAGRPTVKLLS